MLVCIVLQVHNLLKWIYFVLLRDSMLPVIETETRLDMSSRKGFNERNWV